MTIKKITFIVLNLVNKIDTMQEQNMKFQEKIEQKVDQGFKEVNEKLDRHEEILERHENALIKAKLL